MPARSANPPAAGPEALLDVPGAQWVEDSRGDPPGVPDGPMVLAGLVGLGLAVLLSAGVGDVPLGGRVGIILLSLIVALAVGAVVRGRVRRRLEARAEAQRVQSLAKTRQWPQALATAGALLSGRPSDPAARVQALMLLGTILARYGRFDEAAALQERLLGEVAGPVEGPIRLGLTFAQLRGDRLADADASLRRLKRTGGEGPLADQLRAGVVLLEVYRDVLTYHNEEAVDAAETHAVAVGRALGDRAGDLRALLAVARQRLGDEAGAARAWREATVLVPAGELTRRYPEVAEVADVHEAVDWGAL